MKLPKILRLSKKGAKSVSGSGKAAADGDYKWPEGIKIGVYGHANSGKTVLFTVLNEESKVSKELQLSITEQATAGEFLRNYRKIWGIGATDSVGTMVDLREDKKFPDPTQGALVLQFVAILDRDEKVSVVALDYDGRAIDISESHDLKEKVGSFMSESDGIIFLFDPKALSATVQCQAHAASFVNILEQLAPLSRRLPIPVTLVVTKADILPGFAGDQQTVLVSGEDESFLAEDYEVFLEKILASNRIASNSAWAGTVRDILIKLKEFLKVVVGRTLDFQIFFVSATGSQPEKVGTDVGRSIYVPPDKMKPIGVQRPFYWMLRSILRGRRIDFVRRLTKWVAVACMAWIVLVSLPYAWHFWWLLPRTVQVEDNVLGQRDRFDASSEEQIRITRQFRRYENSRMVRWFFDEYITPSSQIRAQYDESLKDEARADLDERIRQLTRLTSDPSLWPKLNPLDSSLLLADMHLGLVAGLKTHHEGDTLSELYRRSGRALTYWELLKQAFVDTKDTAAWNRIVQQISNDRQLHATALSNAEKELLEALAQAASGSKQQEQRTSTARQAGDEFKSLARRINDSNDASFLLGKATRDLRRIRSDIAGDPSRAGDVAAIDDYLGQAKYFDTRREYAYAVDYCPEGHHVHVTVIKPGGTETWPPGQIHPGRPQKLSWKSGDVIYIALDPNNHDGGDETFGKSSKVRKKLESDVALFEMQGEVTFPNGQSITVNVSPDPREKLPKLRE